MSKSALRAGKQVNLQKSVHQAAEARQVQSRPSRPNAPGQRHDPSTNTPALLKGKCHKCGNSKHLAKDCHLAKKPGHTVLVCLDDYNKANPRAQGPRILAVLLLLPRGREQFRKSSPKTKTLISRSIRISRKTTRLV